MTPLAPAVLVWELLFDGVAAQFAEDAIVCENTFGWREPTTYPKAPGVRKISWVPGDPTGDAGKLASPVQVDGLAKSLATLEEVFTVYVYAADVANLVNERAQYRAARLLYDQWFRAVYLAAYSVGTGGRFAVLKHTWETAKKERPHGACIRALCTAQAQIPDMPYVFAPTDAHAEWAGSLGDTETSPALGGITETQTITKDDDPS